MTIATLLRAMSEAGCSVVIDGENIELVGRFPDDLLERVRTRKPCVRSVLLGALTAGMGPMFRPDELEELAGEVEAEDRAILERRWVVARPIRFHDWTGATNAPEDRPCCASGDSEGSEPMRNTNELDGLYGDAVGSEPKAGDSWRV